MASFTFNTTRNPRSGKRERKVVSTVVVGITEAVRTFAPIDGSLASGQATNRKEASAAVVQVMTEGIMWTIDGTDPTAVIGFNSNALDLIYLDSAQKVKDFKAIREAAVDSSIEVVALFGV